MMRCFSDAARRIVGVVAVSMGALALVANAADTPPVDKPTPPAIVVPAASAAQDPVKIDQTILSEVRDRSEIMKNLRYISDVIGPRLTGSKGLERANNWTAEVMKSYGLSNVHLEPWEIPIGWERGPASMTILEPTPKKLTIASAGWSPGTKGKKTATVIYLNVKTRADLEKYKGKLKDTIIIRTPPTPVGPVIPPVATKTADGKDAPAKDAPAKDAPAKATENKTAEGKAPEPKVNDPVPVRPNFQEQIALQRDLNEFLKTEGAIAVLRDSGKPHGLLVTTGSWREGDRGNQTEGMVSLFMAHEDYALLYRYITEHKITPKVEIEVENTFTSGPVTCYNTVGEIVGSEKPDEFVCVGAHLDSWDLATGTTDNGTGSSVVLEVARVFTALAKQGIRPKRTIRFILYSGEEQGLHGSKQYVKRHKDEMAKTTVSLVHDTGTGRVLGFGLQGRSAVEKVLAPQLDSLKAIGFEGLTLANMGGTDHLSFEAADVPGFACKQDPDEYRFTHHTQSDTFDKAKEPNLIQGAQVIAVTAMRIANMAEMLPRDKPARPQGGRRRPEPETKPDEKKVEEKKAEEKKPPQ